ncbi:MAG: sulfotransferase domain-containing protein [Parasphingorhabdus sp.]|uniref:sulfotransferase domain-containing protein n=1 Tax=Parasphingorhabdus sp. TaxID=2709688 RepID=UPI00327BAE35
MASFPKSGNTWLRILLNQILSDGTSDDINDQKIGFNFSSSVLFDEAFGFDSSEFSSQDFRATQHMVFDWYIQQNQSMVLKVHNIFDPAIFAHDPDWYGRVGAVYLVRNPLDVLLSAASFYDYSIDTMMHLMCENKRSKETSRWMETSHHQYLDVGNWPKNVKSWLDADIPKIIVRYEDLLAEPVKYFGAILDFLGLACPRTTLIEAVENTKFSKLQAAEEKAEYGFGEAVVRGQKFFRKGKSGDWKNSLSDSQVDYVITHCGGMMKKFGYISDSNVPLTELAEASW